MPLVRLKPCDFEVISLNTSTLLTFDSLVDFGEFEGSIEWQTHKEKRHKHLVYIHNASIGDLTLSTQTKGKKGFDIDKTAFLFDGTEESFNLATFLMFTEKKCRENQILVINRFKKNTLTWESSNFYPNKYKDFHGCPLTYMTRPSNQIVLYDRMMNELRQVMHFKLKEVYATSYDGSFEKMRKRQCDFYNFVTALEDQSVLHIIVTAENAAFIIPCGEPLTQLEKLLSPFDTLTWFLILATLVLSFIGIQAVSFSSRSLKHLCFGKRIGSPTINFLNVFLCGGQTRTPETSSARFIFVNVMIWSIIIRTCFQSLMYRALQLDLRHPQMKIVEDLLQNQFRQWSMFQDPETKIPKENLQMLYYKFVLRTYI